MRALGSDPLLGAQWYLAVAFLFSSPIGGDGEPFHVFPSFCKVLKSLNWLLFLLSFRLFIKCEYLFANNFSQSVSCLIIILKAFLIFTSLEVLIKTSHFYLMIIVFHILAELPEVTNSIPMPPKASWFWPLRFSL